MSSIVFEQVFEQDKNNFKKSVKAEIDSEIQLLKNGKNKISLLKKIDDKSDKSSWFSASIAGFICVSGVMSAQLLKLQFPQISEIAFAFGSMIAVSLVFLSFCHLVKVTNSTRINYLKENAEQIAEERFTCNHASQDLLSVLKKDIGEKNMADLLFQARDWILSNEIVKISQKCYVEQEESKKNGEYKKFENMAAEIQ